MKAFRHGDVILKAVELIPSKAKDCTPTGELVLAEGEMTGHSHRFPEGVGALFKYDDKVYLKLLKDSKIDHQEHGAREVTAGIYEVDIQQEWKEDGWAKVID